MRRLLAFLIASLAPLPAQTTAERVPTLFVIGDSTVRNGSGKGGDGLWGWGEPLADYFDQAKIHVVNRALGGRSSRTFITEGRWDAVLQDMSPGDFVIMQFGHNDPGPLDDTARARGTLRGIGEETKEIDNPITHKHEVVHTYGWYMRRYVADARAKGVTPIVCSLIPRNIWKDGKVVRSADSYAGWAAQVAADAGVAFIDLNEIIARRYDTMGPDAVKALFPGDHTHTNRQGAEINAECVIFGLKALKPDPLRGYYSARNEASGR